MYRKILLPVDLALEGFWRKAGSTAMDMARLWGGEIRVLYVIPAISEMVAQYLPPHAQEEATTKYSAKLEEFATQNFHADLKVSTLVRTGEVYKGILREAEKWGADAVVMASHCPGTESFLLGKNAARVVRHAMCSVFIIRE